jgi:hypothetical protein
MNIKLLKFIVIFMGILIIFGIVILGLAFYNKFKNISNKSNSNIKIEMPKNMDFLDYKVSEKNIYISYKSSNKILIKIYNLQTGKTLKEIEILK